MQPPRVTDYRGKWVSVVRIEGERKRISLGNLDATDANREAAERAAHELARDLAKPVGGTCSEIVPAYIEDIRAGDKERLRDAWKALKAQFGPLHPDQITRQQCRRYREARRAQGRQDGTIRKELGTLRAAVNWFAKDNSAVFELPEPPAPKERWLTKDEFTRLLDATETPHLKIWLHLAIATGGRKEALLELRWTRTVNGVGYVDLAQGVVDMGRKENGKKRAVVPMTNSLRVALREAKRGAKTDFVIEYDGAPVGSIKRSFATACRNAGLKDVTPHTLRHSAAVWMAAAGVDMARIAQYLGHTDSRVTERVYARFAPDHLRDAAAALEL